MSDIRYLCPTCWPAPCDPFQYKWYRRCDVCTRNRYCHQVMGQPLDVPARSETATLRDFVQHTPSCKHAHCALCGHHGTYHEFGPCNSVLRPFEAPRCECATFTAFDCTCGLAALLAAPLPLSSRDAGYIEGYSQGGTDLARAVVGMPGQGAREALERAVNDMRRANRQIDEAGDGNGYQIGLISLALMTRQFLRVIGDDVPLIPGASPPATEADPNVL